jgi:small subunit ribosomal protein S17
MEKITKSQKIKRRLQGVVVSTSMQKTIVVRVDRKKLHPKYKKYYTVSKKYKVHCENTEIKKGDKVIFEECRPLSKTKRWRLISKL